MIQHPFNYDLHQFSIPGTNGGTMICFHGYGDSYEVAIDLKKLNCIHSTLVSFNFPDYGINQGRNYDPKNASFGTVDELLPALYVLCETIFNHDLSSINLYGFSAGGGALINVLMLLNTTFYDAHLQTIGIDLEQKKRLLNVIQNGIVILDTPLKSIKEIIDFTGTTEELEILSQNYLENDLIPLNSLEKLKGLSLKVVLHFQEDDEVLSNRDDLIYINKLRSSLPEGNVKVIIGHDGGHLVPHMSLWNSCGFCSRK